MAERTEMTSRARIRAALDHKEADRVPFDLGATGLSTMHITAYRNLREHLGLPRGEAKVAHLIEQLVTFEEDIADLLQTDARCVKAQPPSGYELVFRDEGPYQAFTDEWGVGWRMPKSGGFYYDMYAHPLAEAESLADIRTFRLPDPLDDRRFASLRADCQRAADKGKAVIVNSVMPGIVEVYSWLRGYEAFYIDMAINQKTVAYMLDRLVDFKCAYWERVLSEVGDLVDVVIESEDLAGQNALLFSPNTYRKLVKPRHQRLYGFIKAQAPVKVFCHSCGAIRPIIGDLIDAGVDILNPVQISATGMVPRELKRDFGRDVVFWGGGADTQNVLGTATPEEIDAHVKENIEAFAPGGGFVFAAVHDIQANVPPRNVMAMHGAWKKYGGYA